MTIKNKFKWFKKRISWNYKYFIGKWDYMVNEEIRYNTIVDFIKQCKIENARILDIGCGYGALNKYLNPDDYSYCLGVDLSDNAIYKAKKSKFPKSDFIAADAHKFYPTVTFDIIIFNEVLYYLDNQMDIVSRFTEYFNDNGYFIFSFFGGREDLVIELNKKYSLIKKEIVKDSKNLNWCICLFKAK